MEGISDSSIVKSDRLDSERETATSDVTQQDEIEHKDLLNEMGIPKIRLQ